MKIYHSTFFKVVILIFLSFLLSNCKKDDDTPKNENNTSNLCNSNPGITGVIFQNPQIEVIDDSNNPGYLYTVTIINQNDYSVNGSPYFVIQFGDGTIATYEVFVVCNSIGPDSNCNFEFFQNLLDNMTLDFDIQVLCAFYNP